VSRWFRGFRMLCRVVAIRPVFATVAFLPLVTSGPLPVLAADAGLTETSAAQLGGPFTLVDHHGLTVTDKQFHGKWLLVYFGYTHCPDACPTALSDMAAALSDLEPEKRDKIRALFISVDPERDTPTVMKDYVEAFESPNIVGLTGTNEQVRAVEAAYRVRAQRYEGKDGDYAMSHTSAIHIMDPAGHFVTLTRPEQLAAQLALIVP
jgi:protein SCO1